MTEENQEPETINLGEPEGEIHTVNLWVRLGNNLIDQFIITYLISFVYFLSSRLGFPLLEASVFTKGTAPISPNVVPFLDGYITLNVYGYLIMMASTFFYYILMEGISGQTLGKMITRTVVVNRYGEKPLWGEILVRTLCRFIPFDALSFIPHGIGWHDRISQTYVKQVDPIVRNF